MELTTVKSQKLTTTISLPGELMPYEAIDVYARETGFVKSIKVDHGSRVKQGELIAELDAPELVAQRAQANADLNDPFELLPYNLSNPANRLAMQMTRNTLSRNRGMLCFSQTWRDPVLWAHYSDKHRGICIGFEIPSEIATKVRYKAKRLPFPKKITLQDIHVSQAMLFTKYRKWEYEREIRVFAELNDQEDGLYFREFDDILRPVEVIAGATCTVSKAEIRQALGTLIKAVMLVKARAGFKRFAIVVDRRGFVL